MKRSEIAFGVLKIPLDFFLALSAFWIAYYLRPITNLIPGIELPFSPNDYPSIANHLVFSSIAAGILVVIFALNQMYTLKLTSKINRELSKIFFLSASWFMLMVGYFFVTRTFPFSRLVLVYSFGLTIAFISIGRILIRALQKFLLRYGIGVRRILVIGNNKISNYLNNAFKKNKKYECVGILNTGEANFRELLEKIIKEKEFEEIIQTDSNRNQSNLILDFCRGHHIQYSFVPEILEIQQKNIEINSISEIPVITLKPTPLDGWGKVVKRLIDIIGSALGLIIFSPLLIATAIAIKLDSKGPVLFSRLDDGKPAKRVGQQGRLFRFYKFRSMHPGTHSLRYTALANKNLRKNSPLVKIKDDPRVTPVGHLIRKTSIDELPQLWNVLRGHMSLVGPRPHLPEEVSNYQKHHKFVLTVKPGITGLAQTTGRSDLDFEEEVKLDTNYIQNWSPLIDIKIILKTLKTILKGYKE